MPEPQQYLAQGVCKCILVGKAQGGSWTQTEVCGSQHSTCISRFPYLCAEDEQKLKVQREVLLHMLTAE